MLICQVMTSQEILYQEEISFDQVKVTRNDVLMQRTSRQSYLNCKRNFKSLKQET